MSDVSSLLQFLGMDAAAAVVREKEVDGRAFMALTQQQLSSAIADGGFGLNQQQLDRIQVEMDALWHEFGDVLTPLEGTPSPSDRGQAAASSPSRIAPSPSPEAQSAPNAFRY